jgi:serine/threonine protein kinase
MQILMGLEYIHGKNIIYRGVSSQNIYMNHQGDMKLGSFGLAKVLENTLQKANTVVGSPCNLSPEIVEGKPYNSKADIWSLGCLIYELATFHV